MLTNSVSTASYALQQNLQRFAIAADRISDPDTEAGLEEIVQMKQAEQGAKVNVAVLRAANEMSDHLLDLLV